MSTAHDLKLNKPVDYRENIRKLLGWQERDKVLLDKYFGFLKGKLKQSPVGYQRQVRKTWNTRMRKLEKITKKK